MSENPTPTYTEQASIFDRLLDGKLTAIRAREADGDLTILEAATARVEALQHHIAAIRALREEHFGTGDSDDDQT